MGTNYQFTGYTLDQRRILLLNKFPELNDISVSTIRYYHEKYGISAKKPSMVYPKSLQNDNQILSFISCIDMCDKLQKNKKFV